MRIALVHALAESVVPAHDAFAAAWPEAYVYDILDSSLAVDLSEAGRLEDDMFRRFRDLADYASSTTGRQGRTAGILFTCSAFGPAIDAVKARHGIPVLRPNESAFELALSRGRRIGLIVSFPPSAASLEAELHAMAGLDRKGIEVHTVIAEGALAALKAGDGCEHDRLVAAAAGKLPASVDVVVLGQYSLARAQSAVAKAGFEGRVITTPRAAVEAMRCIVSSCAPDCRT